jgi:PleD family two-component response regulator
VRNSSRHTARSYRKFLSASVGVTPYSKRIPFDSAVEMADRMMYERKKAHRRVREDTRDRKRPSEKANGARDKPN